MPVTPDIIPLYLHPHAAANEPVTLHEGPIGIQGGATGTGTLTLRWLPSTGLRLDADLNSMDAPQPDARVRVDLASSTAEVLFNSMLIGNGESGPFAKVGGSISAFEEGTGSGLKEIGFQVVNFQDFLTPGPKQASVLRIPATCRRSSAWRLAHPAYRGPAVQGDLQEPRGDRRLRLHSPRASRARRQLAVCSAGCGGNPSGARSLPVVRPRRRVQPADPLGSRAGRKYRLGAVAITAHRPMERARQLVR